MVERRARQRVPLIVALRYTARKGHAKEIQDHGWVVNINSSGVAFRTEAELTPGLDIEASMEWPVALDGKCLLRVTIKGRVVRMEQGLAVMSVAKHEFRTGGRVGLAHLQADALKRRLGGELAPNGPTPLIL